jgi:Ca2+-binding RTX toxin-like protein
MAIFPDPQGDGLNPVSSLFPDLESVSGAVVIDNLIFTLDFYNSITPSAINGSIDLDTDQNVATGSPEIRLATQPGQSNSLLGADVRVFFSGSTAFLADVGEPDSPVQLGQIPIAYSTDQITVTIPLLLLNNCLGYTQAINFIALVNSNDVAPNGQVAVVTGIPVPPPQTGTAGDDQLTGTEGRDDISGLAGNDTIRGLTGADFLKGDEGNDRLEAGIGNDIAQGGEGDDQLLGGEGSDQLIAGAGNDQVNGDQGSDQILGEVGNDKLNGGQGSDTVFGGQGNDQISEAIQRPRRAPFEEDTMNGEGGNDTIDGGIDSDTISGGNGRDRLTGGNGSDTINGDSGNDVLIGVNSRSREDISDTLTGGTGRDRFILGDANRVYYLDVIQRFRLFYNALITDFTVGQDTMQLNGSADLYRLSFSRRGGVRQATLIYEGVERTGPPEEIAILQNVSRNLSLTSRSFDYV